MWLLTISPGISGHLTMHCFNVINLKSDLMYFIIY